MIKGTREEMEGIKKSYERDLMQREDVLEESGGHGDKYGEGKMIARSIW